MCGIVGFLDKQGNRRAPVGHVLLKMLVALGRRGPDSAGVALYGDHSENVLVLRIKLGEQGRHRVEGAQITETVKDLAPVVEESAPCRSCSSRLCRRGIMVTQFDKTETQPYTAQPLER